MAAWQRGFASVAPGLAQAWVMAPAVNMEVARILVRILCYAREDPPLHRVWVRRFGPNNAAFFLGRTGSSPSRLKREGARYVIVRPAGYEIGKRRAFLSLPCRRSQSLKYFSAISLPLQDKYVFQHSLDGKFLQDRVPATINSRAKHHPPQFGGGSYLLHTTPTRRAATNGFGKMIGSRKIIRSCCGALGIVKDELGSQVRLSVNC
ncbi:hypothetical protein CTAM01_10537 [Colletotrichum tamarilloi]|uniref:Uncharacterized protein n=1 Tax=Colletotrichum tamarilloi TaxID=1209934 RepID=A0ABQ9R031_9PEZI|nr:uncharacterized protein CTAM01_10537 [Colletotrichum tamarilloi]KAK1490827.1 hypothetical protein CTAM01_10537 [Colletotrichum tamarilloi]